MSAATAPLFSGPQRRVVASVAIYAFLIELSLQISNPYLAGAAQERGASALATGEMLALYGIGLTVGTPFMAALQPQLGHPGNAVLIIGSIAVLVQGFRFVFAWVVELSAFIELMSAAIFVNGFIVSGAEIAAVAWLMRSLEDSNRDRGNSIFMTTKSIGASLSPAAGGLIYEACHGGALGFAVPFIAGASCLAIGLVLILFVSGPSKSLHLDNAGVRNQAFDPTRIPASSYIVMASCTVAFSCFYFHNPFFQPWLTLSFGVSEAAVGFILASGTIWLSGSMYMVPSLVSRLGPTVVFALGFLVIFVGQSITGPSSLPPFSSIPPSPWNVVGGLYLTHVGLGFVLGPMNPMIFSQLESAGFDSALAGQATGTASIICFSVSMVMGPVVGGALVDNHGQSLAYTIDSIVVLATGCVASAVLRRRERDNSQQLV